MTAIMPKLLFESDKPPIWFSYIQAGLVIVDSESFGKFNPTMFEFLLKENGSDKI